MSTFKWRACGHPSQSSFLHQKKSDTSHMKSSQVLILTASNLRKHMNTIEIGASPANFQKIQDLLSEAILAKDIPVVHKRLAQGAGRSGRGGKRMRTPLMHSASVMDCELIELFMPFEQIDVLDLGGEDALFIFLSALATKRVLPTAWRRALGLLLGPTSSFRQWPAEKLSAALTQAASAWSGTAAKFIDVWVEVLSLANLDERQGLGMAACKAALSSNALLGGVRASSLLRRLISNGPPISEELQLEEMAHLAATHGRAQFLQEVSVFSDLEARDSRGRTPLMAACSSKYKCDTQRVMFCFGATLSCIPFLLSQGCDARAVDRDGCDALMLFIESSVERDDAEDLDLLVRRGIPQLVQRSDLAARDFLGESALDKARDLKLEAVISMIELALGSELSEPRASRALMDDEAAGSKLQELLFQAIEANDVALAKKRLEQGADALREAVPVSCVQGHSGMVGHSPLMAACIALREEPPMEMLELLAPLSDLLAVNADGETALSIFARQRVVSSPSDIAAMALLASPAVIKKANNSGSAPLAIVRADEIMWPQVIELLGPHSDWMALDAQGNNVLASHRAQNLNPYYEGDLALLAAHPDPQWLAASANDAGETILHIAASCAATSLLAALAPFANFSASTREGFTPLMAGCMGAKAKLGSVGALLAPWSNGHAVDANGCDALMLALERRIYESDEFCQGIQELVRWASLDARDFLGESALDKAVERGLVKAEGIIRARMAIFEERDALGVAASVGAAPAKSSRALWI